MGYYFPKVNKISNFRDSRKCFAHFLSEAICFPDNFSFPKHGSKFSTQTPRRCSIVGKHLFRTNRFQNLHYIIRLQLIFIQNLLFSQPGLCTKQQTNSHQQCEPIEESIDKKTSKVNVSRSLLLAYTYLLIGRIQQENHQ